MFRKNKDHLQQELFNSYSWMNPKVQASLRGTWAPLLPKPGCFFRCAVAVRYFLAYPLYFNTILHILMVG